MSSSPINRNVANLHDSFSSWMSSWFVQASSFEDMFCFFFSFRFPLRTGVFLGEGMWFLDLGRG